MDQIKIFEIGTVFKKSGEEMHVAYGDKKNIVETTLEKFVFEKLSSEEHGYFSAEKFLVLAPSRSQVSSEKTFHPQIFKSWSIFPFVVRDVAVWVPEGVASDQVAKIIKENVGDMVIKGPELFDEFKKNNQISYAFRLIFQSYDSTLTDEEVNVIMTKITNKIKGNNGWQVR
jgi:phenylalanyl-tRNA synthetase beta subunit